MTSTTFNLSTGQISTATGCPSGNVNRYWPAIRAACIKSGLADRASLIAVLATIGTEVATFEPINERGDTSYFIRHYEGRIDLGNTHPGDGVLYHGRGFIQITGRANYRSYGRKLGVPLERQPELALDGDVAARVLARYFSDRQISESAERGDWREVRRKVNGGLNGWKRFQALVGGLEQAAARNGRGLTEGAIGPEVTELKRLLNVWGKKHPLPKPLKDTPLFGPATTAAVKAFQKAHGIQATGKAGKKTWRALEAAVR